MKFKKAYLPIIVVIMLFLCTGIGYYWGFKNEQAVLFQKLNAIRPLREKNSAYKLIDPLLAYILPSSDQQSGLSSLKSNINNFVNDNKKNNNLSDASVFLYDLNKGRWVGVNETEKYNPASMLKVVIMVAYFKESEVHPEVLNNNLVYTKSINEFVSQDQFNSLSSLAIGNSYSVSDLINKMIIDSDNGAEYLLLSAIDQNSLDSIYNALSIENPSENNNFTISPRTYSLFLRILYSATYLNDADSEKALDILSKTTFTDGLVAGLPKNITAAHKFGEYVLQQNGQPRQIELHDCGIVYYPQNPYLLCIMTKGNNLDNLKSSIKNISGLVYQNYSKM